GIELPCEGRHRRSRYTVTHQFNSATQVTRDDVASGQCRECGRQALSGRLVTADAGTVVNCFAVSHGVLHGNDCIGELGDQTGSVLTLCVPGVVFFLLDSVHHDWHEAV